MAAEIQRSPSNGTAPETANGTNNRAAAGFAAIWHARWMRRFRRDRMAVGGVIFVVLLIFVAVLAPWLAPYDPAEQHILYRLRGPNEMFRLGTDEFGRDVLSRLIYGSRASLVVGLASVFLAGVLGTVIG
ncbi:MAG: hypothetical protein LOD84_07225, partial [Limnochordales bacterium]